MTIADLPALGRRDPHPAEHAHHRVRLASYLPAGLPAPPPTCTWTRPVHGWGEYGNAGGAVSPAVGNCGVVAPANLIRCWTANTGAQRDLPLDAVLAAYTVVSGWDPADPTTDTGAVLSDVLAMWHAAGPGGIGGDVIAGFGEVEHEDEVAIQQAVALFGGCILGLRMPRAAQGSYAWLDVPAPPGTLAVPSIWGGHYDLTGDWAPGSWGNHGVVTCGYDLDGCTVVTWGNAIRCSWRFLAAFCDEAWVALSPDWLRAGMAPSGLDLAGLQADLAAIADTDAAP